ncbi:response regulator transcription factor [Streptomyces sp. A1277]|uniref:winged helix-turn-helix domain-containing protein n=1 Tax=Streptomyces sp. A1277 TaxID=2563103 RepID=UPI0010A218EA|nr:winged helix-turn-helix domain-containing protein [Streptomyces sp. A1277]THA30380.1 response regulator transcription factor [Streptomyces sp. A1277]
MEEGILRLLIVEGGGPAPICSDAREDWARAPISNEDLRARVTALRAKSYPFTVPTVDASGALKYRDRVVAVSPVETALLDSLTGSFQALVCREELLDRLGERQACISRNALDLHIMRIRRRIQPLGLVLQTAWGRGYILAPASQPS